MFRSFVKGGIKFASSTLRLNKQTLSRQFSSSGYHTTKTPSKAPFIAGGLFLLGGGCVLALCSEQKESTTEAIKNKVTGFFKHRDTRVHPGLLAELKKEFGENVSDSSGDRESHGKDQSYHEIQSPDIVVYPTTEEQVAHVVQLCAKYNTPVIGYGGGTSLEGHINASKGGVCIDFKTMKAVLKVNKDDLDCIVQPGITYDELNEYLEPMGLFFPMDPGPGATIGGMVGTSCSGTNAVRYGTMKENVKSLRVVLPNGKIVKTRARTKKSSAGYDLTHLFIGAEGTLGLVTEATLKLQHLPQSSAVALVTFEHPDSACNTVIQTIQNDVKIGRVEFLDDVMMKAVNIARGTKYDEKNTLLFEFSGTKAEVSEQITAVQKIAYKNQCGHFKFATERSERESLWLARKVALWSSVSLRPEKPTQVWITDVCVPISRLADIISATKEDLKTSSLLAPLVSHAGDGNFHLFILLDPTDPEEMKEAKRINENLVERAIKLDGTCTGEHGVGYGKKKYLEKELGPEAIVLMRTIKHAIDPQNIMNPNKIIDWEQSSHPSEH